MIMMATPQGVLLLHGALEIKKDKRLFHHKCYDCGKFLKRDDWVEKNHKWKEHALYSECVSDYDDIHCM